MRLLVECTFIYNNPHINSGIQRVVRNLTRELQKYRPGLDCIPVIFKDGRLYRVTELTPKKINLPFAIKHWIQRKNHQYWTLYHRIINKSTLLTRFPLLRKCTSLVARMAVLPLPALIFVFKLIHPEAVDRFRAAPYQHHCNDVLLLLDSSWGKELFPAAEKLKRDGVQIVSVVYDLIPLIHPQFCETRLIEVFEKWISWAARTADGFLTISKTISAQLHDKIASEIGELAASKRWIEHFYLGSELDLANKSTAARPLALECFGGSTPVYLMVGTIEPRKNHSYLLDAFDRLWDLGIDVKLCIVGKVGWKCTELITRIKSHKQLGQRLFAFHDLSDAELEYCYRHAKALIFPSFAEGFGLPIVEAMQRGLPVMASDIPVFREIGSDFIAYFDLKNPDSLAELVTSFEKTGKFPAQRPVSEWQWINWSEAADMLLTKILSHIVDTQPLDIADNQTASQVNQ